jgi:hypothetical protein
MVASKKKTVGNLRVIYFFFALKFESNYESGFEAIWVNVFGASIGFLVFIFFYRKLKKHKLNFFLKNKTQL